jgi:hypothetical protein
LLEILCIIVIGQRRKLVELEVRDAVSEENDGIQEKVEHKRKKRCGLFRICYRARVLDTSQRQFLERVNPMYLGINRSVLPGYSNRQDDGDSKEHKYFRAEEPSFLEILGKKRKCSQRKNIPVEINPESTR